MQAAGIAGAVVLVAGTGLASAFFVDYLADRAVARTGAQSGIEAAAATPAAAPVVRKPAVDQPATAEPDPLAREQPVQTANAPAVPRPASGGGESSVGESGTDRTFTAAIAQPAREAAAPAPLPVITIPEAADGVGEQAAIAAAELPDVAEAAEPTRSAKVTKYVNLRAGPNDESMVLTVVPARDTVQVVNCDSWCEVEFKGQKGFIYKSFIDG